MYQFPSAAVPNNHKLSLSKKTQIYYLQFWRSEVQNQFHWADKVLAGLVPPGGSEGRIGSFACFIV